MDFEKITIEYKDNYALVGLNNAPVNALTLKLWEELAAMLLMLEEKSEIRGLIFHSTVEKDIFSAGNDLLELYAPKTSKDRFYKFWVTQTNFLARLYRTRLITIACIRGYCPAGGCGLSLCCDYRIMTDSKSVPATKIGLNEVMIGILVPKFWAELFLKTAGVQGRAEKCMMFGKMLKPKEALSMGIVDELCSKEELVTKGELTMTMMLQLPDAGRIMTKSIMREEFSKSWEAFGPEEARRAWAALESPSITKALGYAMKNLKKSKI